VPDEPPGNQRDLMRVVKIGTALSMGLMAGFLFSLKQVHPTIELRFGLGTVAAFLIAAVASWRFCGVIAKPDSGSKPGERRFIIRWLIGFIGLSGLGTLVAFGYALRNVSSSSRWEVIEGTVIAVAVLTVGGWFIYKAFRFFEEQSEIELEQQRRDHENDDHPET
jgi:hypothetical protein